MDKREAITTAQQYVNTVSAKYPLSRSLFFGSYAKGTHHRDSDIDVAVVLKNTNNLFDSQVNLLHLRKATELQIEPHVFREKDFDTDDPLVYEILQAGVELSI
jgi:predicted nucleotidyltransferase